MVLMNWAALIPLSLLLCQEPPDPMAQASAHLDAGRYAQAIEILKPLAAKDPKDVVTQFNLALAYTLSGQDALAIDGFRVVLSLKDDLYEGRLNLGQLLVKTAKYDEAIPLLRAACEQKPADAKPVFLLARAQAGKQDWAAAAPVFEKAIELDAKNTDAQLELASIYEKLKQNDKAAAIYARFPDDPAAQQRRGVLLLEAGDFPGAIESLEAARKKDPSTAVMYALATAYLRAHKPEQSVLVAEKIVAAERGNFDMRMFYGRLLRDAKRYSDAGPQFMAAVRLKPEAGDAWSELTAILILLKQYESGLAALEKSKALNGETPAYHFFRATMLDAMNQPKPALESYQRFLAVSGGKFPDEEWKARQRAKLLEKVVKR